MYLSDTYLPWISLALIVVIAISGILINITRNAKPGELKKSYDGQTILWFRILYPLGIAGAFASLFLDWGKLSIEPSLPIFWTGIICYVAGLGVRWIAILSLKNAFTVKISIIENHQLKTDGIYRWMRHPSYSGLLLYYLGLGLVMNSYVSLVLLLLANGITLMQRIPMEELALQEHFGIQWESYARSTKRLIPGIY